jgi:hypothetical protein
MRSIKHELEYLIYGNSAMSGKAAGELAELILERFEVQRKNSNIVAALEQQLEEEKL